MKKLVLSVTFLLSLAATPAAHAQAGALVNLIGLGARLGTQAALKHRATPAEAAAAQQKMAAEQAAASQAAAVRDGGTATPATLILHRTPADKLPKQAAAQLTDLEAQLDACHAAMLASPTGPVCPPEQRAAIQRAAVSVARAKPSFDLQPYQQEMAYYMAEDARRQPAK